MSARRIEGQLTASQRRFALVAGRFNRPLTDRLVDGAIDCLVRHGGHDEQIDVVYVPGSFEVPQMVEHLARGGGYDAIVALSVLIRGETPHFELIARTVTSELSSIAVRHGVPVTFGIVTADTVDQAEARTGVKGSGKGWDAAMAAMEMASLVAVTKTGPPKR
jgi:6,7-dimethyl-8-ribityllumazine synthase